MARVLSNCWHQSLDNRSTSDNKFPTHMDSSEEARHILDTQNEKEDDAKGKSSLPQASFNYINSIIGSGIIGMAYALHQAGVLMGLILFVVMGIVTDYSLVILVKSSNYAGVNSYPAVMHAAFGRTGYVIISILQFVYPSIAMVSYNVIVGDTITKVVRYYGDMDENNLWGRRDFIVCLTSLFVCLPLSLYKGMARLSKISFVSLVFTGFILLAIFVRAITLGPIIPKTEDAWQLFNNGVTQSIAISAFAFMCHHSTFLVYGSLRQPSEEKWRRLTHMSLFVSALIEISFALVGYATFTGYVQGDLLENYCRGDHLINAARVFFCITILLTYPIECFVARDVALGTFCQNYSHDDEGSVIEKKRLFVTIILVFSTCLVSFATDCLGIVLELNGTIAAIPLAYILPAVCYLRLEPTRVLSLHKLPAVLLAVVGTAIAVSGIVMIGIRWGVNSSCSHGTELFYCRNSTANSTADGL